MCGSFLFFWNKMRCMESWNLSIYIKAEDIVIYLPFGMYDNVFCMTRDSLVGQMLSRIYHLFIINEKNKKDNALKCALLNVNY